MTILIAEDDEDDIALAREAAQETHLSTDLHFVKDGQELMDYLKHASAYTDLDSSPRPCMILLDLNMPRKDGRQALKEIKSDPAIKDIPVIIFTTSTAASDINQAYEIGANSYLVKPVSYTGLVEVMEHLKSFWLELVELPNCHKTI
ncbi:MAG: response regulator [Gallionella sp.]